MTYLIVNIPFIRQFDVHSVNSWVEIGVIFVVFVILLMIGIRKRSLPKFKEGEYGIIFSFDTEDDKQISLIRNKFIKEFQYRLKNESSSYRIIVLPQFVSDKMKEKYLDKKDYEGLCEKTNCKFVIHGRSVVGGTVEKISCKIHLDDIIFYNPIPAISHLLLQLEMNAAFKPIRDIEIYKITETSDFEKHARQLNLAFDYILGSTHLLQSEYSKAISAFEAIKENLKECDEVSPMIERLNVIVPNRLYWCYVLMSNKEILEYYEDNDYTHVKKVKFYLDKAYLNDRNGYDFHLIVAIYYFLEGDVETALTHIEECKKLSYDKGWKISKVFLKLYQKDSFTNFMNAYKVYDNIFDKPTYTYEHIANIAEFIHKVLEKEPEKKQLNFLLFLIYHYMDNKEDEDKYYNAFIDEYENLANNQNFAEVLSVLGKEKREQQLAS